MAEPGKDGEGKSREPAPTGGRSITLNGPKRTKVMTDIQSN